MTEQAQAPSITVQDVAALLQIVDVAATRGAFRGEELTAVGSVRDKAAAFVDHIRQAAAEAAREEATEQEEVDIPGTPV